MPISSTRRRCAACTTVSSGRGWLQPGFVQSPPLWYFVHRTTVQQQVSFAVEDKHTEGPVQDALTVGLHLLHGAERAVFGIYENHIFDHGLGLIGCE